MGQSGRSTGRAGNDRTQVLDGRTRCALLTRYAFGDDTIGSRRFIAAGDSSPVHTSCDSRTAIVFVNEASERVKTAMLSFKLNYLGVTSARPPRATRPSAPACTSALSERRSGPSAPRPSTARRPARRTRHCARSAPTAPTPACASRCRARPAPGSPSPRARCAATSARLAATAPASRSRSCAPRAPTAPPAPSSRCPARWDPSARWDARTPSPALPGPTALPWPQSKSFARLAPTALQDLSHRRSASRGRHPLREPPQERIARWERGRTMAAVRSRLRRPLE